MPSDSPKFYLTTPIYYVNARPHIGHAYTTIVADVLARRHRLLGHDTFFLTGTDEHGQKIERSAAAAGIPPQEFTDRVSAEFRGLWDRMGLTYDRYIRTTDPCHKRGAQKLFSDLYDRGAIYLSSYTGQYSIGEEIFVEGPPGTIGPDGKPTETVTEENFFFRLSDYQRPLIDLIESDTLRITPEARKNEVLSFLRGNVTEPGVTLEHSGAGAPYVPGSLRDLSVSRTSFSWGIPVPDGIQQQAGATGKHIMYVWLDALANYMTAIGYGSDDPKDQAEYAHYWPADVHIMAKEITRQHCVYWPAFLLAAGLPLPKAVTAHGWLLFDNAKMSKSKGNIVRTETILDAFGDLYGKQFPDATKPARDLFASDVLRYFLLREIPFGQDGSFSFDALITRYNADLANGYGNLVSRTLAMIAKYFDAAIPTPRFEESPESPIAPDGFDASALGIAGTALQRRLQALPESEFTTALQEISGFIALVDGFITSTAPWKLAKDPARADRLATVLYLCAEAVRWCTGLLHAYCPFVTAGVWSQLGLGDISAAVQSGELASLHWGGLTPGTNLGPLAPIFPRADKGLAQIMTEMEESRSAAQAAASAQNRPDTPFTAAATPTPAAPVSASPTDPAAPPRTSSLDAPIGDLPVAGSSAEKPALPTTPGPHSTAQASGAFAATEITQPTKPAEDAADASAPITIDDFIKVELRVAQILVAERIPKADKLLRLEVDLGTERRQILSGIAQWYSPEELVGRRIVIVANLAPRKMRGLESHGMLLAASEGENGKPVLATFGEDIALGSRVR